jgi:hypothetical protein
MSRIVFGWFVGRFQYVWRTTHALKIVIYVSQSVSDDECKHAE